MGKISELLVGLNELLVFKFKECAKHTRIYVLDDKTDKTEPYKIMTKIAWNCLKDELKK